MSPKNEKRADPERTMQILVRGVIVVFVFALFLFLWKLVTGRIEVREPTCADFASNPRDTVPARGFRDYDPSRP